MRFLTTLLFSIPLVSAHEALPEEVKESAIKHYVADYGIYFFGAIFVLGLIALVWWLLRRK